LLTYALAAAACTAALAAARLAMGGAGESFALSTVLSFAFLFVVGGLAWRFGGALVKGSVLVRSLAIWGGVALAVAVIDLAPRMAGRSLGDAGDVLMINLPVIFAAWLAVAFIWGGVFKLRAPDPVQTTEIAS
jgi:hypothetical protein